MKIKNYILILCLFTASVVFPQGTTIIDSIKSAGLTAGTNVFRSYRIYIPKYCIDNPSIAVPLIFNFHGTTMTAQSEEQMCGFDVIADTAHFIIVYPQGLKQPNSGNPAPTAWNSLGTVQQNKDTDLKFTTDLLDSIESWYSISTCRVYATGMSIGGFMTHDVGCFLSSRFAAIASVSGIMLSSHHSACNPTHPTPVMQIHGDADNTVNYNGGTGMSGVDTLINWWVNYDNCTKPATKTSLTNSCTADNCTADNYMYPNGKNTSHVELYRIVGGDHAWPSNAFCSSSTPVTNHDFNASLAIWKFFRPYCLDDLNGTTTCTQPSVTTQPSSTTVCAGNNTTFGIAATGTGLSYQWQVNSGSGFTNITNTAPYSTVTTATVTITGATSGLNGYKYQCIVSGTCTPTTTATSSVATLTIPAAPTATVSGDATICSGTSTTISIAFTGTGPWTVTKAVNGVSQTPVSPPTSPYTFNASASGVITVAILTDNNGCTGTSSGSATVKVISAITTSNKTEVCNSGNTDYVVEFDIAGGDTTTYAVTGGTGTFTTPTHFKSDPIASGTSYSITVNDNYSCGTHPVVTGTKTCSTSTSTCTATAVISGDTTLCPGTSAAAIISIALTGTPPWSVTYAIGGVNQTPVPTSSSTYTFTTTTAGIYTLASVTDNASCTAITSGSATVTTNTAITTSHKTEVCNGSGIVVEFDIIGGDSTTYKIAGGTGIFTSPTHFKSDPITTGPSYTLTVTDTFACATPTIVSGNKTCGGGGCNATAVISGDTTVCPGTSISVTVSIALTGTPPWSVVYKINNANPTTVPTSSSTYTFTTTTAGVYTLASVTDNASCTAATSGSATVKVNSAITTSNKTEVCNGGNTTYVVEFDISGGDQTTYTVTPSGSMTTLTHFKSNPITSGTAYSFIVNDKYACSSPPLVVSGNKTCTTTSTGCSATATISGNTTICSGTSAIISVALGGTAPWSFAYAVNGGTPTMATSTSATYTFAATTSGVYTLSGVTDATQCTGGTTGGNATITVNSAITTSAPTFTCNANSSSYTAEFDISGGDQASYAVTGGTITNGNHFTSSAITSGTSYSFTVNDAHNCAPVSVIGTHTCASTGPCNATATISGGGTICHGSNTTMSIALTGQAPWSFTINPGAINVSNQNTSPYTITASVAGSYSVTTVYDATCKGTSSGSAVVQSCVIPGPSTGIEENSDLKDILIYPNPTNGIFSIVIKNANFTELQITIVDIVGTEVFSSSDKGITSDYLKQINIADASKGMYYIKLNAGADIKISKLIVQ